MSRRMTADASGRDYIPKKERDQILNEEQVYLRDVADQAWREQIESLHISNAQWRKSRNIVREGEDEHGSDPDTQTARQQDADHHPEVHSVA